MTNLSKELCEVCGIEPKTTEDYNLNEYKAYPDFEQPENFVKLYEIISKQSRTEILNQLVRRLRVEAGWYTDELKQSIREAEWVYG